MRNCNSNKVKVCAWMTNLCPDMLFPYSFSKASVAYNTPRPVAASLPRDPPRS